MKLLMHICCANCSLYPLSHLSSQGMEVKGLWFNPNIHPEEEYQRRLAALRELQRLWTLDIEYLDVYGLQGFLSALKGHEGLRCAVCYRMRLEETARTAKKMGLRGFTTTLLASPYQKFDLIVETGREIGGKYSLEFYAEDLRPGWAEAKRRSRELGLYRQKYCGCVFSRAEREEAARNKKAALGA